MSQVVTTVESPSATVPYDTEQVKFMNEDMCITVDENDRAVGQASKKECHLMTNINKGMLHRAFSVFLFNNEGKLLLQQRSDKKITFPGMWTNTCCSHPLANEADEANGIEGVKIAAQRKLKHELNIPPEEVPLQNFKYITRIHYLAKSAGEWGEHEVDYILFIKCDKVSVDPNPGEVKDYKFATIEDVKQLVEDSWSGKVTITPWFHLIFQSFLAPWWEQFLKDPSKLLQDDNIHKL